MLLALLIRSIVHVAGCAHAGRFKLAITKRDDSSVVRKTLSLVSFCESLGQLTPQRLDE